MNQTLDNRWLICRICLKSEHKKLYPIFEDITEEEIADLGTTLLDKIELCGNIKLHQQHNLPNRICNRCVLLLRAAYKFRDLCQQSQNQLKQFFDTVHQKQEDDEEEDENNSTIINFLSDSEEQKQGAQEDDNIILTEVDDYVVEENVVEYDSSEERSNMNAKTEEYLEAIDDEETEFPGFSDEEDRQYIVEEVDAKQFVSEDNEEGITTYKFEEDIHSSNAILEEQPQKTNNQIYFKRYNEKKPGVRRKRRNSPEENSNGVYNCTLCDNSYTDKTKFNNHMKIHGIAGGGGVGGGGMVTGPTTGISGNLGDGITSDTANTTAAAVIAATTTATTGHGTEAVQIQSSKEATNGKINVQVTVLVGAANSTHLNHNHISPHNNNNNNNSIGNHSLDSGGHLVNTQQPHLSNGLQQQQQHPSLMDYNGLINDPSSQTSGVVGGVGVNTSTTGAGGINKFSGVTGDVVSDSTSSKKCCLVM